MPKTREIILSVQHVLLTLYISMIMFAYSGIIFQGCNQGFNILNLKSGDQSMFLEDIIKNNKLP